MVDRGTTQYKQAEGMGDGKGGRERREGGEGDKGGGGKGKRGQSKGAERKARAQDMPGNYKGHWGGAGEQQRG